VPESVMISPQQGDFDYDGITDQRLMFHGAYEGEEKAIKWVRSGKCSQGNNYRTFRCFLGSLCPLSV
jgi:hypothetical protein